MHSVINSLFYHHDLRFVALAAVICALSAFAGIVLLDHAQKFDPGRMRLTWLGIAAGAVGFGIWGTHFVAMLSFDLGMPAGYDLGLTLLSLAVAITVTGLGLWVAATGTRRSDKALGGVIVGIGIASMHYIGMRALIIGGDIVWDAALVASSLILGMVFGGAALLVASLGTGLKSHLVGAMLLTIAICAMHFTGMGAANMQNCYAIVSAADATPEHLGVAVGIGSIAVLMAALTALALDLREEKRSALEILRMRGLADAAVEGLMVCRDDRIVQVNTSFCALVGQTDAEVSGQPLSAYFDAATCQALFARPDVMLEADLTTSQGTPVPVEVILRAVDYGGKQHSILAIRDLSASRRAEQHIRFLAHHDALTGLPNRDSFNRHLESEIALAQRQHQSFAVLCLDLDRFKEVNDLFGHSAGDALLRRVGQLLLAAIGDEGLAARLGSDEFCVIIPDIGSPARAGRMAEAILDSFRDANRHAVDGMLIAASIGIALFPDNATDTQHLVTHANTALNRAKHDGRGIYRFFEANMGVAVRERRLLENDLRHAISRQELHLLYQPQVNIASGAVTGFEALLRWTHPGQGQVSPGIFIPIAEESGLIGQIGEWVLLTACTEAASWSNPVSIAVNVSAVQMQSPHLPEMIAETLRRTGLAPHRLEIEITETALNRDINGTRASLQQIKSLGVRVAMDDFGTGYSSLANLRAFPFDKIKIDQSFVAAVDSNEQSAAIVRAVLGLGAGLKLPVLAEGIERVEELDFLRAETCAEAQGYLLGRPDSISTFADITSGRVSAIKALARPAPRRLRTAG